MEKKEQKYYALYGKNREIEGVTMFKSTANDSIRMSKISSEEIGELEYLKLRKNKELDLDHPL